MFTGTEIDVVVEVDTREKSSFTPRYSITPPRSATASIEARSTGTKLMRKMPIRTSLSESALGQPVAFRDTATTTRRATRMTGAITKLVRGPKGHSRRSGRFIYPSASAIRLHGVALVRDVV